MEASDEHTIKMTSKVVSAYLTCNSVSIASVSQLISATYSALLSLYVDTSNQPDMEPRRPAVPVKRSVEPDFIICLEDGKKFKSLKRYLRTQYSMTPDQYRSRWRLPSDYPMVAPNYAETRSNLAKEMRLGHAPSRKTSRA